MNREETMRVIICVDDKNGMTFNRRRQSQDRILRQDVLEEAGGGKIRMNAYSAKQFADAAPGQLQVEEEFLEKAGDGDLCFVENRDIVPFEEKIEEIILYRWNRTYPADTWLQLSFEDWNAAETKEFAGSSHEKITKERYRR